MSLSCTSCRSGGWSSRACPRCQGQTQPLSQQGGLGTAGGVAGLAVPAHLLLLAPSCIPLAQQLDAVEERGPLMMGKAKREMCLG